MYICVCVCMYVCTLSLSNLCNKSHDGVNSIQRIKIKHNGELHTIFVITAVLKTICCVAGVKDMLTFREELVSSLFSMFRDYLSSFRYLSHRLTLFIILN